MIQIRSPKVVLPNVKCVRQLQYLVFARDSDADLVQSSYTYLLRPRLDFLSMTKFYILRKLRKGSKDDFKVEINYEITYHIENEKKKLQNSIRNVATKSPRVATKLHCTYIRIIDQISTQWSKPFLKPQQNSYIPFIYVILQIFYSR